MFNPVHLRLRTTERGQIIFFFRLYNVVIIRKLGVRRENQYFASGGSDYDGVFASVQLSTVHECLVLKKINETVNSLNEW
jgi:hypothetical protein